MHIRIWSDTYNVGSRDRRGPYRHRDFGSRGETHTGDREFDSGGTSVGRDAKRFRGSGIAIHRERDGPPTRVSSRRPNVGLSRYDLQQSTEHRVGASARIKHVNDNRRDDRRQANRNHEINPLFRI